MKDNLALLQNEKNEIRKEILSLNQIQYLSMFSFLALIGAIIGIIGSKPSYWPLTMFAFSQVEFTMIMLNVSLLSNIYMLGGYARVIENKINDSVGERVTIWESNIAKTYFFNIKHGFTISHIMVWIYFITLFLFLSGCSFDESSYTGLSYCDVRNLRWAQIKNGIDDQLWVTIQRQKTGTTSTLPLLRQPLDIINKYKDHPRCIDSIYVLPVLTNQKMNSYLKEIADLCGIDKVLTFHIARHTFATTIALNNGVPIETVSKILGHKTIKQTQHYAKISDTKVSQDMKSLRKKLS